VTVIAQRTRKDAPARARTGAQESPGEDPLQAAVAEQEGGDDDRHHEQDEQQLTDPDGSRYHRVIPRARPLSSTTQQSEEDGELTDVEAHITGTVWKIEVEVGDTVAEGDAVVILESMKMEMPVEAEDPGVVSEIRCSEGQSVSEGDTLVVLD
jgi:acetyl-CoA carboxylase biotin carboxyl carrier protein